MTESRNTGVYETVNFFIRPKKQIERKIIIEVLQSLKDQINLIDYKYVGFGSIYYYDFILFHKLLNLNKLISIDDKSTKKRFEFNRPYDFVEFENEHSTDFLNKYTWKGNSLIWLDNDKNLSINILDDLKIIGRNCNSKDIVICTVSTYIDQDTKKRESERTNFEKDYGKYISPGSEIKKLFTPKNIMILLQDVIMNYLISVCEHRTIKCKKLFCFSYRDSTPMLSLAVIFGTKEELTAVSCKNNFYCEGKKIIEINVPILTYREKDWLDSHIYDVKKNVIEIEKKVDKLSLQEEEDIEKVKMELLNSFLPFEVSSFKVLKNYVENYYRYFPQYYEGMI